MSALIQQRLFEQPVLREVLDEYERLLIAGLLHGYPDEVPDAVLLANVRRILHRPEVEMPAVQGGLDHLIQAYRYVGRERKEIKLFERPLVDARYLQHCR